MKKSIVSVILALPLSLILLCGRARGADTWSAGVNTMFIQEYALYLGVPCPECPGNLQPHSLADIQALVSDLAANQHVGTFRETIPLELLSPHGTNDPSGGQMPVDSTNYASIDAVMSIYKNANVHLILAIGNPVPSWAAPWANSPDPVYTCFLPPASDAVDFNTFKNNVSWTVGNYLNHLKQIGYGPWMAGGPPGGGGLFVEGFTEWNFNGDIFVNCDRAAASPDRAASLQQGITWVANYYGVTATIVAVAAQAG